MMIEKLNICRGGLPLSFYIFAIFNIFSYVDKFIDTVSVEGMEVYGYG